MSELVEELGLDRPVLEVARGLLGSSIVAERGDTVLRARIVEAEAYSEDDPASHSYNGPTDRSAVMFGPPGFWYIYKCYGIHWMTNVVCGEPGHGEAVLIRAVEPVSGLDVMTRRRGMEGTDVTNGPGKLSEALGITEDDDRTEISRETGLYLEPGPLDEPVVESTRIGIQEATERPWRFYLEGNDYVSRVKAHDAAG